MLWLLRIDIFHGHDDCDTGVYQIQKIWWSSTHNDYNEMTFLCADYTKHKQRFTEYDVVSAIFYPKYNLIFELSI